MNQDRDIWLAVLRRADQFNRDTRDTGNPWSKENRVRMAVVVFLAEEGIQHFIVPEIRDDRHQTAVFDFFAMVTTATHADGVCTMDCQQDTLTASVVFRDEDSRRRFMSLSRAVSQDVTGAVSFGSPVMTGALDVTTFANMADVFQEQPPTAAESLAAGRWLIKRGEAAMKRLGIFTVDPEPLGEETER